MSLSTGHRTFRLFQHARTFVTNARGIGRDMIELATLEAKVAVASAVSMAIFSVVALVLVITGWILLIAALVAWIADNWLDLPAALLVVGVVMLVGVVPCILILKGRAKGLSFPATRRQLESLRHGE